MREKRKFLQIQDLTQRESVNPFLKAREEKVWAAFSKKFEAAKAEYERLRAIRTQKSKEVT